MNREFLIDIITRQNIEGEEDKLQIMTKAVLEGNSDNYKVSYVEQQDDGSESTTTLHVENGSCITVVREGAINTHMIVEKNVRHISHHVTPYGNFSMGVSGASIDSRIDENGGKLKFSYCTDIDMTPVGKINFDITLKSIII